MDDPLEIYLSLGIDISPYDYILGIDEAGRGPWAGSVFAAAVLLKCQTTIDGVCDSKKISHSLRQKASLVIQEQALSYFVASASVLEIDRLNILNATFLAMNRAYEQAINGYNKNKVLVLIDGNRLTSLINHPHQQAIIKGDQHITAISAASILAKSFRDAYCLELHVAYPKYAFDLHKGYGTTLHAQRLKEHGPCKEHRRSFKPIKALLQSHSDLVCN